MENAALQIVQDLEAMAVDESATLYAAREQQHDGSWIVGLRDGNTNLWLTAFADGVSLRQAAFLGGLYNHSHTLLALARIGLQACGITDAGEALGCCRTCGSPMVEVTRKAAGRGEVWEIRCPDCESGLTQIVPLFGAGA